MGRDAFPVRGGDEGTPTSLAVAESQGSVGGQTKTATFHGCFGGGTFNDPNRWSLPALEWTGTALALTPVTGELIVSA